MGIVLYLTSTFVVETLYNYHVKCSIITTDTSSVHKRGGEWLSSKGDGMDWMIVIASCALMNCLLRVIMPNLS